MNIRDKVAIIETALLNNQKVYDHCGFEVLQIQMYNPDGRVRYMTSNGMLHSVILSDSEAGKWQVSVTKPLFGSSDLSCDFIYIEGKYSITGTQLKCVYDKISTDGCRGCCHACFKYIVNSMFWE